MVSVVERRLLCRAFDQSYRSRVGVVMRMKMRIRSMGAIHTNMRMTSGMAVGTMAPCSSVVLLIDG